MRDAAGKWTHRTDMDPDLFDESHWEVSTTFDEVPAHLLADSRWTTSCWGRFTRPEGILILECRAMLQAMRRLANSVHGLNARQVFLLDNMSLVLSLSRSRSASFHTLVVMRRIYSYALAKKHQMLFQMDP